MAIVKVENNGIEQSVHLPKEYHLNTEEVFINKIGEIITLAPISSLKKYYDDGCNMLTDDFLADGIPEGYLADMCGQRTVHSL